MHISGEKVFQRERQREQFQGAWGGNELEEWGKKQ